MPRKKDLTKSISFWPKTRALLVEMGFLDGRDYSSKKGKNLSGLVNKAIQEFIGSSAAKGLIRYYKWEVGKLNEEIDKRRNLLYEYQETIQELRQAEEEDNQ